MSLLSAKSKMTRAFCAMSSSSARTFSSSGSATWTDRVMGFRDELRRRRMPSVGLPNSLRLAMLSTLAIAAVGLPTRARGEPGKRSIGWLKLRGELERRERGRGDEDIEYGWGADAWRCEGIAKGGVPLSGEGAAGGYGVFDEAEPGKGEATPIVLSGRLRNPRDGRRATTFSRFGTLASSE